MEILNYAIIVIILISIFINFYMFRAIETTIINRTDNILNNQTYLFNLQRGLDVKDDINKKTKKKN